jgi:hypothetical protein
MENGGGMQWTFFQLVNCAIGLFSSGSVMKCPKASQTHNQGAADLLQGHGGHDKASAESFFFKLAHRPIWHCVIENVATFVTFPHEPLINSALE